MRIRVRTEPMERVRADWIVSGAFEDSVAATPPGPLGEWLAEHLPKLRAEGDFEGKANELLPIVAGVKGVEAQRLLLVGLGKSNECSEMTLSRAASTALRRIGAKPRSLVVFDLFGLGAPELSGAACACALTTGALIGSVGPDLYRTEKKRHPIDELQLCCAPSVESAIDAAVKRGTVLGEAVNLARELVNRAPETISPQAFCEHAALLAGDSNDLEIEVLGPDELAAQGMRCILGVGAGSQRPPRLLVMRYHAGPPEKKEETLALVGKGITFDSGGLSLKTAEGMATMKSDMAGAATVLAATHAVARLALPINLIAVMPLAENMPSGSALRPGDVLTAKNGKTIEVLNTDAEGRLVLADALCHAVDLGASRIVDVATLTGACVVALGTDVAGVMSNERAWGEAVLAAADRAGELAWPLPMFAEYDELIDSTVADMKNIGGRWGGAITAAKLLSHFVGDVSWTHVDIAGPSFADKENAFRDAGGTGFLVRTLIELAEAS